jgi:hypothetical protein
MLTTPGAEEKPSWPLPVGTRILSFDRRPKPVDSVMVAVRATEGLLVQEGVFSCSASTTRSERERSIVSDQKEYNSDFGPRTQHNHCCWGMNRRSEATRGTSDWTPLCARCRATTLVSRCVRPSRRAVLLALRSCRLGRWRRHAVSCTLRIAASTSRTSPQQRTASLPGHAHRVRCRYRG